MLSFLKKIKQKATKHGSHKRLTKSGSGKPKSATQRWRIIRRRYPVLFKMSLRTRVPDKMLDQIRKAAGDPKLRGLVRKVVYKNDQGQEATGYSVLMLSNDALTQAGFGTRYSNPNRKDFGRLIKDIRNNDIFTVTLLGDASRGLVVLRPDIKTIKLLRAYGELDHSKLRWGVFPTELNPTSGHLECKVLSNLTPLKDLVNLAQQKPPVTLEVNNDEMVVANNNDDAKSASNSDEDQSEADESPQSSSADSEDKTLTESIPTASDSSSEDSHSSSQASSSSTPYQTFTAGDDQGSTASSTSTSSSESENILGEALEKQHQSDSSQDDNDDTEDEDVDDNEDADDEDVDSEEPENSESEDSENTQSNISDYDEDQSEASLEDSQFAAAMEDNPNATGETRQKRNHEASQIPTKQSPADFYNQMDNADDQTFNDKSLGISIDYDSDLSSLFKLQKPPLFKLKHYKKGNRLGQLLNQYRTDCNSSLMADQQQMVNSVNADCLSRIEKVIIVLEHRLSVDDTRNPYGAQMSQIGKTYDKQLRYDTQNADRAENSAQRDVNQRKKSYVSRIAQQAAADFDADWAGYPRQYRQKYEAERHSKTHDTYLREKADLYNRRRHIANVLAFQEWSKILDDARKHINDLSQNIVDKRNSMQNELVSLSTHYYEAENKSESDQAAVADSRTEMTRLQRRFAREQQMSAKQLASERADNKRQRAALKRRMTRAIKHEQKMTDYYRNKYTNVGEEKDKYYHKRSHEQEHQLKQMRKLANIQSNNLNTWLKTPQHQNQIWHNPWTYVIISGAVVALIVGGIASLHSLWQNNNSSTPLLSAIEKNDNSNSQKASASNSASSLISSYSASASSAVNAESQRSHSASSSSHSDLMTNRPDSGDGYVATSETHSPTNYVKIGRNNKFTTGASVTGTVNGKSHQLQVIVSKGNEVYLKDSDNGQVYEFNR